VNGARLWYDEAGSGPAVVLVHGGLGDSGLWAPVVPLLAGQFRVIRSDLRFFGRSAGPAAPWSWSDDIVGVLDELGVERAALVGLSLGGRLALDVAVAHPERLWALVHVAGGVGGHGGALYTEEQETRYEAAEAEGNVDAMMDVDFEVWAPLGADEAMARLWHATPDATGLPPGVAPRWPATPALEKLGELEVPTLVVTVSHDPEGQREAGLLLAHEAPNARHVDLDSDHYVTLREPELVARTIGDFLETAA
jgi:pimeloyl-ACP methyl ester carboxylesterase